MQSFELLYKSSVIRYGKAGHGKKLLLCFHGYAQSSQSFSILEKKAGNDFIIIAIDFPFHGKTVWNEGLDFTASNLVEIIFEIIKIHAVSDSKLCLMGFSMGGRVCLSLLEQIPDKIEKMVLIAPDGLKESFWYWLAAHNKTGNKFFRQIMQKPDFLVSLSKAAKRMKLVNQSVFKFISYYIHDKQVREDLYNRWTTMHHFRPDIKHIQKIISNKKIPVRLLYGEFDRVIRYERAQKFIKKIKAYCNLKIAACGHLLLTDENAGTIMSMLRD
ncbi:MAG: alpha/beta hydrolase [Bacteroidetes bacterium]|nr:alpha/beta hydrolase [Bacteroidota bacterium]MBS1973887.1 alpha/beta hydrolase [Bacteroidota bacterium]